MATNTYVDNKPARKFNNLFPGRKRKGRDVLALSPAADGFFNLLMIVTCLLALIPIYVIVISSVTAESALSANGYRLWPEKFATIAYKFLFTGNNIYLELLNIDQDEFRKRLFSQLNDSSNNRPFDVSTRPNPIADSRKRCFKTNHRLYEQHEKYQPMPMEEIN